MSYKQITSIKDYSIISELKTLPNQGILWEIINTNITGKIYQLSNSAVAVIENCGDPFVFLAGDVSRVAIDNVISLVQSRDFPMVLCNSVYHSLFEERGWDFNIRAQMKLKRPIAKPIQQNGFVMKKIDDLSILQACNWYKEKIALYGSAENFLHTGKGVALFKHNMLVSEAYASIGADHAEIGVVTSNDHRNNGYAHMITSHLIYQLLEQNLEVDWSCQMDNRASLHTALKLGFDITSYTMLMVPTVGNVLGDKLVRWLNVKDVHFNDDRLARRF